MNLSCLRYFIEIAECKSFTRASQRLFVTQPTLSRQIKDLEEELGTTLFVRGRHSFDLTDSGKRLLKEAREIVKRCDNLREVVLQKDDNLSGSLQIAYQAFLDTTLVHQTIRSLTQKKYKIDLSLLRSGNQDIGRKLMTGVCDLAYTMHICIQDMPDLEWIPVRKNHLQIAIPKDHPLADRDSVNIRDLSEESFIMLERQNSPMTVDYVVSLCTKNGFSPKTFSYVNDIETALILVEAGQGITFIFSEMNVNKRDVRILDVNCKTNDFNCILAYKKDNQNPMVPLFVSELKENLGRKKQADRSA